MFTYYNNVSYVSSLQLRHSVACNLRCDILADQTCKSLLCTECRETQLGREYMGTQNTTRHGYTCQAWASNTPHNPSSSSKVDSNYPEGSREAASNYCRNPNGHNVGLWCYTTDSSKRWDYCDIPLCPGMRITFTVVYRNNEK